MHCMCVFVCCLCLRLISTLLDPSALYFCAHSLVFAVIHSFCKTCFTEGSISLYHYYLSSFVLTGIFIQNWNFTSPKLKLYIASVLEAVQPYCLHYSNAYTLDRRLILNTWLFLFTFTSMVVIDDRLVDQQILSVYPLDVTDIFTKFNIQ